MDPALVVQGLCEHWVRHSLHFLNRALDIGFTNGLFDIAEPNFELMLRNEKSMPRSKESIMEDMQFLQDQRSARKMGISHQCDMEHEEVVKRRTERYRRHDEYRKNIAAEGFCDPFPDEANDIFYDPVPVDKGLHCKKQSHHSMMMIVMILTSMIIMKAKHLYQKST